MKKKEEIGSSFEFIHGIPRMLSIVWKRETRKGERRKNDGK